MFCGAYCSAHEPEAEMLIPVVSDLLRGRTDVGIEDFLTKRDARLRLDLESSSPLVPVVPHLVRLFPDARFVLTARDPRSWFASQASHLIRNKKMRGTFWQLWREARFAGHEFSSHDQPLRDAGLYPLAGFLSWWTRHNQIVLDAVPPERLLIVKTNDIGPRAPQIASFLGADPRKINLKNSHRLKGLGLFDPPGLLDDGYLTEQIERFCGPMVRQLGAMMATGKFSNDRPVRQVRWRRCSSLRPRLVLSRSGHQADFSLAGRRRCSAPRERMRLGNADDNAARGRDRAHRVRSGGCSRPPRPSSRVWGVTPPFSVLDFPDHGNVGDAAIALGTTAYFREHRGAVPSYVASLGDFSEAALRAAVPEGPIFIHGGGNFGDLWPRHQDFREHLLQRFTDREIIQLPQSIHFDDRGRVARSARVIAGHGKFRLLVRDLAYLYEFAGARTSTAKSDSAQTWPSSSARWSGPGRPRWTCFISCVPTRSAPSLSRPGWPATHPEWPTGRGGAAFRSGPTGPWGPSRPSAVGGLPRARCGADGTMPPPARGWSAAAGSWHPAGSSSPTGCTGTS